MGAVRAVMISLLHKGAMGRRKEASLREGGGIFARK